MAEQIISASGTQYGLVVNSEGRALVDLGGDVTISGVNIDSIVIKETVPTDSTKLNPAFKFEYIASGTATGVTGSRIGSVTMFVTTGSFVDVLSYNNNRISNIGSWS